MMNLCAGLAFHARRTPDKTAIIYEGQQITFADLHARVMSMAAKLRAMGIGEGDVIALFMKNSPAYIEISFAASAIGAIFLPINFRLAAPEAEFILQDSGAKLLFVDDEFPTVVALSINKVVMNASTQADTRQIPLPASASVQQPIDICVKKPDDLVRLMYTSGTTSRPKGVMHTYSNLYWKSIDHIIALGLSAKDILLVVGPLYHVGAYDLPGVAVLEMGGTWVIQREFDPETVLKSIDEYKITCSWMAPVMVSRILSTPDVEKRFDLSTFKWVIAGGEKTPETRIRDFSRVFKHGRFIDAFGMTETCSADTMMEPGMEIQKIGSTGRALAHVEIKIMDGEGRALPPNTNGEICIRGPKVTKGYWNAPEKTAESFWGDWLRSGDIGYLDEDGFLYLTDRAKDMILTGAENVASSEVEAVIYKMPQVAEVAVIGLPDEKWGERVVAVVVPHAGQTLTLQDVEAHCRQHLAGFKVPREIRVTEALPRNPSGKVLKRVLRDEYKV